MDSITRTLIEILKVCRTDKENNNINPSLRKGDIIALSLGCGKNKQTNYVGVSEKTIPGIWHATECKWPLFDDFNCEILINSLVNDHGLCIVLPAGNGNKDLSKKYSKTGCRRNQLYSSGGPNCGAIVTGFADVNGNHWRSNRGDFIDIYSPQCPDETDTPEKLSICKGTLKENTNNLDCFPIYWMQQTSTATMVVAAALSCMQNLRIAKNLDPYMPDEAKRQIQKYSNHPSSGKSGVHPCIDLKRWATEQKLMESSEFTDG